MIFLERRRSLKNLYFLVCFYQISRWISNMNFDQVHLHVSLNPDVWQLRPRMHVLLASKCPTRKSIMIRPAGKKPLQNRALQLHKTCDAAGQLSSDGSGRVQRAQVLQVCNALLHATAPPCTCTCAAAPRRRAGPSQGPLFRSTAHGGRERARAKVHLFKRSSRRFLPFFDSADLCQLKSSLGAGQTGRPVVQLEVKWSQFSWARKRVKSVLGGQPVDNQKWRFMFGGEVQRRSSRWIGNMGTQSGAKAWGCEAPGPQHLCKALGPLLWLGHLKDSETVAGFSLAKRNYHLKPLKPTITIATFDFVFPS